MLTAGRHLRLQRAPASARETLRALHTLTFPHDVHEDYREGTWWIVRDNGHPVGFAGMRPARSWPHAAYFSRAGVLPSHRGLGLQRRLIQARVVAARRQGFTCCITTTFENPVSANNLALAGFAPYLPEAPWGADGTTYWLKPLC